MTALSCGERPADSAMGCELGELRDRLRAAEAALDHVSCAVVVLDAQARVQSLNRAAQSLLLEGDGLTRNGNGVTAHASADAEALRQLLARASGPDGAAPRRGALRLRRGSHRAPLVAVNLVPGLGPVLEMACGYESHSMAVKVNGEVWTWGQNNRGQLGDGTTTTRTSPVQVPGLNLN